MNSVLTWSSVLSLTSEMLQAELSMGSPSPSPMPFPTPFACHGPRVRQSASEISLPPSTALHALPASSFVSWRRKQIQIRPVELHPQDHMICPGVLMEAPFQSRSRLPRCVSSLRQVDIKLVGIGHLHGLFLLMAILPRGPDIPGKSGSPNQAQRGQVR